MSKYVVTRSFYEGNDLHEEGSAFEHSDQKYVEKCLADGNIAEGEAASSTPSEPTVTAPEAGTEVASAQPPLVEEVQTEETTPPVTPVAPQQPSPVEQPVPVQQDPNVVAPTPEELQKDFEQTSSEPTAPSNGVQLQ